MQSKYPNTPTKAERKRAFIRKLHETAQAIAISAITAQVFFYLIILSSKGV